jgi:hypothetical protein
LSWLFLNSKKDATSIPHAYDLPMVLAVSIKTIAFKNIQLPQISTRIIKQKILSNK